MVQTLQDPSWVGTGTPQAPQLLHNRPGTGSAGPTPGTSPYHHGTDPAGPQLGQYRHPTVPPSCSTALQELVLQDPDPVPAGTTMPQTLQDPSWVSTSTPRSCRCPTAPGELVLVDLDWYHHGPDPAGPQLGWYRHPTVPSAAPQPSRSWFCRTRTWYQLVPPWYRPCRTPAGSVPAPHSPPGAGSAGPGAGTSPYHHAPDPAGPQLGRYWHPTVPLAPPQPSRSWFCRTHTWYHHCTNPAGPQLGWYRHPTVPQELVLQDPHLVPARTTMVQTLQDPSWVGTGTPRSPRSRFCRTGTWYQPVPPWYRPCRTPAGLVPAPHGLPGAGSAGPGASTSLYHHAPDPAGPQLGQYRHPTVPPAPPQPSRSWFCRTHTWYQPVPPWCHHAGPQLGQYQHPTVPPAPPQPSRSWFCRTHTWYQPVPPWSRSCRTPAGLVPAPHGPLSCSTALQELVLQDQDLVPPCPRPCRTPAGSVPAPHGPPSSSTALQELVLQDPHLVPARTTMVPPCRTPAGSVPAPHGPPSSSTALQELVLQDRELVPARTTMVQILQDPSWVGTGTPRSPQLLHSPPGAGSAGPGPGTTMPQTLQDPSWVGTGTPRSPRSRFCRTGSWYQPIPPCPRPCRTPAGSVPAPHGPPSSSTAPQELVLQDRDLVPACTTMVQILQDPSWVGTGTPRSPQLLHSPPGAGSAGPTPGTTMVQTLQDPSWVGTGTPRSPRSRFCRTGSWYQPIPPCPRPCRTPAGSVPAPHGPPSSSTAPQELVLQDRELVPACTTMVQTLQDPSWVGTGTPRSPRSWFCRTGSWYQAVPPCPRPCRTPAGSVPARHGPPQLLHSPPLAGSAGPGPGTSPYHHGTDPAGPQLGQYRHPTVPQELVLQDPDPVPAGTTMPQTLQDPSWVSTGTPRSPRSWFCRIQTQYQLVPPCPRPCTTLTGSVPAPQVVPAVLPSPGNWFWWTCTWYQLVPPCTRP
ncbi:uncharacterized protein [Struthio camelus]|uniref:uncharacterized protein n=1 Tax=Struthio camelus TaxID=8801 RepID=UPI00360402BA